MTAYLQLTLWLSVFLLGFHSAATGSSNFTRVVGLYFMIAGLVMLLSTIQPVRLKQRIRIGWVQPDKLMARLSFAFIVLPTALIGFYGFLLSIECIYEYSIHKSCNGETAFFAPTTAVFSVCVTSLWIKSFVSSPDKHLSRPVQAILLLGTPMIMAFSVLVEGAMALIIGIGYVLALASMAMFYFYNRAKIETTSV